MKIKTKVRFFPFLIVLLRVLFGIGWLLAGVTKIFEKLWFKEPGVFLTDYLLSALEEPDVPLFYKIFIENVALDHVMTLNYVIPIVQIIFGIFIIIGLVTIPSILVCLIMHINFILSGNMNLMSLVLYTSAFLLIIFRTNIFYFGLDKYFNLETLFSANENKREKTASMSSNKERFLSNS